MDVRKNPHAWALTYWVRGGELLNVWLAYYEPDSAEFEADEVSLTEVAQHNTFEDCWIIIDNAVYDISEWKDHHPGGPFVARMYAGKDATAEFGDYHSKRAELHMRHFRVGYLQGSAGS